MSKEQLPSWPRYENDPSFRRWIDMSEVAPDYTFAWFLESLKTLKPAAA